MLRSPPASSPRGPDTQEPPVRDSPRRVSFIFWLTWAVQPGHKRVPARNGGGGWREFWGFCSSWGGLDRRGVGRVSTIYLSLRLRSQRSVAGE